MPFELLPGLVVEYWKPSPQMKPKIIKVIDPKEMTTTFEKSIYPIYPGTKHNVVSVWKPSKRY